ncbi:uncharacterized protein [Antedon mediterranea]|uniref:uncharacterized protein n=1 Tax=Antedon mediterranea TaxID=105859 RepID=UPI003AF9E0C4
MSFGKRVANLDHGWSWVVLCSAFVGMALSLGVILSLTVYLDDLKEEFDVGSRGAGMIAGISLLFTTFISPVASYVCNIFGFRATITSSGLIITVSMILSSFTTTYPQILCSSALTGCGVSLAYTTCSVIMGFYFRRYYVLANGIVFAGVSTGMFALPVLFEFLNSQYTWRQCYRIIAAICLHISVTGALIVPHPPVDSDLTKPRRVDTKQPGPDGDNQTINSIEYTVANTNEDKETMSLEDQNNELPEASDDVDIQHQQIYEKSSDPDMEGPTPGNTKTNSTVSYEAHFLNAFCRVFELRLFLKLDFIILFSIIYIYTAGYMGTIVYFVARFEWVGFTPAKSSFLLSLMGIGGIVSRLTHGFLVDRHCITAINLFFINLVMSALFVFLLTFVSSYLWSQILSFCIGISLGLLPPLAPVIIKDLVGIKRFNSAFGLTIVSYGLADFTGSLSVGWIYDLTEDYNKSFYMTSTCLLSGALLMLILIIMNRKKENLSLPLYEIGTDSADDQQSELSKECESPNSPTVRTNQRTEGHLIPNSPISSSQKKVQAPILEWFNPLLREQTVREGVDHWRKISEDKRRMSCGRNLALDRGWSWVVLFSAFMGMALGQGVTLSLTVFLEDFKQEFDVGSREAGMITGISLFFTAFMSPVASFVCNKFGFRVTLMSSGSLVALSIVLSSVTATYSQMFCTSALTGCGVSFAFTTCSVIMGFYFRRHYVLANGIVFAGVSTGIFAIPPFFEFLRLYYTWRQCYRIIAAVCLHNCVAGALIAPHPAIDSDLEKSTNVCLKKDKVDHGNETNDQVKYSIANTRDELNPLEDDSNQFDETLHDFDELAEHQNDETSEINISTDDTQEETMNSDLRRILSYMARIPDAFCTVFEIRLFRNLDFVIIFAVMFFFSVGYMGTIVHIVARFEWVGFTPAKSSFLLSLMGIGGIVSRLTHGFLVDRHYITAINLFISSLVLTAILLLILTFVSSYLWSQILSFCIGLSMGFFAPLGPVIVKEKVGIERFNSAFGFTILSYGFADFTASLLTGWIYDLTQNYNNPFYMTSACLLFAVFLMLILKIMNKKKINNSSPIL